MEPRISLVIPVRNEARRIATCLAAISAQTLPPIEVILVDGHSTDKTVEIAKTFSVRVFFEEYRTRAGACQVGVEAALGDYVAFTDADCLPDPEWLKSLVASVADGVVGVGGRILNEGDTFWQKAIDVALDTLAGSANSVQGRVFTSKRFVSSISGCNSLYRRSDLLAVGGFRTDLLTTEDTELNRRLLQRGELLYVPDALVRHRHGRGLRDFARRMFQYGYGRGQSLLLGPPLLVPSATLGLAVLFVLLPWAGLAVVGLYLAALLGSSVMPSVRHRRASFVLALPLVYLIEHTCYNAGFWFGVLKPRIFRRRIPAVAEDAP